MVLAVRLTRCTPRERSSSATCRDTSDPEMPSVRAAWLKLRDFVTPTKLRITVSWSIFSLAAEDASIPGPCPADGGAEPETQVYMESAQAPDLREDESLQVRGARPVLAQRCRYGHIEGGGDLGQLAPDLRAERDAADGALRPGAAAALA